MLQHKNAESGEAIAHLTASLSKAQRALEVQYFFTLWGRSYEARVSYSPRATWETEGQTSCFQTYKVVSKVINCCFTSRAVVIKQQ